MVALNLFQDLPEYANIQGHVCWKTGRSPAIGIVMSVVPFALEGFEMKPFTSSTGRMRDVYRTGEGPAVIIIHEIPGITPLVAAFARRIAERGMTAVMPSLLGTAGRPMTVPYALSSLARACVSKEFTLLALNETSPIVDYLRELAVHEREAHGGPGVGAPVFDGVARRELRFAGHVTRDSDPVTECSGLPQLRQRRSDAGHS